MYTSSRSSASARPGLESSLRYIYIYTYTYTYMYTSSRSSASARPGLESSLLGAFSALATSFCYIYIYIYTYAYTYMYTSSRSSASARPGLESSLRYIYIYTYTYTYMYTSSRSSASARPGLESSLLGALSALATSFCARLSSRPRFTAAERASVLPAMTAASESMSASALSSCPTCIVYSIVTRGFIVLLIEASGERVHVTLGALELPHLYCVQYSDQSKKRLSPADFPRHPKSVGPDNEKAVTKHAKYSIRSIVTRVFIVL